MSGRVAVVTGGGSGIGLGIAARFVADGHRVAILDRANADVAGKEIGALGVACDVSDRAAVDAAFAQVRSELGPVSILCTAAGIDLFQPLAEVTMDDWDRVIAVNLTGTFNCVQNAVSDMAEAKWGRVITIASSSAESGAPNMAHYTASKGGVISLTRSIAVEFARAGVTANSITPSICDTPMARKAAEEGKVPPVDVLGKMVPVGRAGTPDDMGAAASFLASDGASYVTGQILGVSGGMRV